MSFIFCFISFADNYIIEENIPYSSEQDPYALERCKLDIYYSPEFKDNPVVIWFHGGGLTGGEKFIPPQLMNDSLVVVAVNYRLLPKANIDDCIDDAAASVAWTVNNISEYGGSPDKIFLAGHSAGGYLLSMIGLDKKWLANYNIDPDNFKALVPYSGQVLTHFAVRDQKGLSPLQPYIDEYAPLFFARKDCPPVIIISGDRNEELFGRYEENAYFWRLLKLLGHPDVQIYELDGYNHGDMAEPAHHILKNQIHRILSNN
ncbi:MAG: alpha/beta hydrolase [Muribaculaceae bacterium]|nr:alpha/beta hydrolase [Muribaculaceae bacterium]